jgi:hypothetical protein
MIKELGINLYGDDNGLVMSLREGRYMTYSENDKKVRFYADGHTNEKEQYVLKVTFVPPIVWTSSRGDNIPATESEIERIRTNVLAIGPVSGWEMRFMAIDQ